MAIPNPFGDSKPISRDPKVGEGMAELALYVLEKTDRARDVRDQKYGKRWDEYTRLWRGFYSENDKNTDSERSRLISPALSQAVEMTASEIEEAIFSKKAWFDVTDDIEDENKDDALEYRNKLLEDFELDGMPRAVSDATLLGTLYGTGILKLNVVEKTEFIMDPQTGEPTETSRVAVPGEAVRPDQFLIDPAATSIEEASFVAHELIKPIHVVREKQRKGIYRKGPLDEFNGEGPNTDGTGKNARVDSRDNAVKIIEFSGKVPAKLIPDADGRSRQSIEALVTVTEGGLVLRAIENPYTMKDRPYVSYQHDTVPGEFWGRGVAEKGYNPQKALDAELRARIDALALLSAPMMGADISRLPRNADFRVRPGKTVFTRGRPSEILEPISFGSPAVLGGTFQHSGDLERMVQMGTGAMDSATPVGVNSRNETSSGMSQLQSGFIKRAKRTMQNIERSFLTPLIRKALWRYMQYDPDRYPVDMKFRVDSAMGIMAKEVENTMLTNMLGYIPDDSPAKLIVVKAIFENSGSGNKPELMQALKQMTQPPSPEEQKAQQRMQDIEIGRREAELEKERGEVAKLLAEVEQIRAETRSTIVDTELEDDRVEIQAANAASAAQKVRVSDRQIDAKLEEMRSNANKGTSKNGD